ncbi:MAG TPA: TetR/AcrR family transcriptional regulator [Streptosporangiaceae bacterium]|nr:TetR/AcrR family transcriptional regulator [Streptosporangiaceae bacterium]HUL24683.1 TetR/AcrR family transcriptional regulator [Streptosporangiaceae bacterium]
MVADSSRPSLRQAQRALTERRILEALAALIDEEHPLEISMASVASRAGVSEPTLYRHFPTKRDLFGAFARYQFQTVAAGLAPASADGLADAVRTVFQRSAEMENPVRWTLAAPDPDRVPRPNVSTRLAMIRTALSDSLEEADEDTAALLLRSVVLLTSPMAWLYWKDYLGLDPAQAAETAGWAIKTLAGAVRQLPQPPAGPAGGQADDPQRGEQRA